VTGTPSLPTKHIWIPYGDERQCTLCGRIDGATASAELSCISDDELLTGVRSLPITIADLCALVSALDDDGKRSVFRALGGMVEVLRFIPESKDEPAFEGPEPLL